jgi:trimeric autotransporter adhesin
MLSRKSVRPLSVALRSSIAVFVFSLISVTVFPMSWTTGAPYLSQVGLLFQFVDAPHEVQGLDSSQIRPPLELNPQVDATRILWSAATGSTWLTNANWTGSAVPTNTQIAQFAANPISGSTGIGINFASTTNAGTQVNGQRIEEVGAVEIGSTRTANLLIGNNSGTVGASGTFRPLGATVNGIDNVIIRNAGAGTLTIQNTQASGTQPMALALGNAADNIINLDGTGGVTINSIIIGPGRNLTLGGTGFDGANNAFLSLGGINTYSGATTIKSGLLQLIGSGSIQNTSLIDIGNGAFFDLTSSAAGMTLSSGTGLRASATTISGKINTSSTKGLTTAVDTQIAFPVFNGSFTPLTVAVSGTLALQPSNVVNVTVANSGNPLAPGDYKLIAKSGTASVTGAPTTVNVTGDGVAGTASLVNTAGELFLHVIAGSPQISVTPSSLNFGNQSVGTTSTGQMITISNPGTASLNVTGVTLTGTGTSDFSNNAVFPQTIAPGGNYQFNVMFSPSARASRTVTMTFAHNAGTTASVSLTGVGVAPVVGVSPTSLPFNNLAVGTTSAPQAFTISNNGDAGQDLQVASIAKTGTNAGDFTVTDDPSPVSIPAGSSVTVHVTFSPSATGARAATLTINNNDATNPAPTISLTGNGAPYPITPASYDFGDVLVGNTTAAQTFTVTNTLFGPWTIYDVTVSGEQAGDFTTSFPGGTPIVLGSGESATFTVTFSPSATGTRHATVMLDHNRPGTFYSSLTGKGVQPTVQFGSASFMEDESQTMIVTVTRTGNTTGTSAVQYSMSDGSAWGGALCSTFDYISSAGTLSFAVGETQRTIFIPLCADWIAEGTQNFSLALSNPIGATLGTQSTATANVNDTASQFRNTAPILVGASTNPSTIDVTGAPAEIGRVRVTLYDLSFPTPDDLDVLLVGPGGQQILLMADAGGSNSVNSTTLTFSDAAGQVFPDAGQIVSGIYEPTSWGAGPESDFPAPAPAGPYNEPGGAIGGVTSLGTVFNGRNGDGTWSLYVRNDFGGDLSPSGVAGQFQGGWGIELLAPTAAPASISGRITDANGYGIGNVVVRLEGGDLSQPIIFQTGPFGYYSFDGLTPGFTYVVSATAKRHTFADPVRVVTVNDNVAGVDFMAVPND